MSRAVAYRYEDPLTMVWVTCAKRIGFAIAFTDDAYATSDGKTISLGHGAALDADDSPAQMIFHELVHSLIQGEDNLHRTDWGLGNTDERDTPREHACLRLQRALLIPFGLTEALAPTTDFRLFYDRLDDEPIPAGDYAQDVVWARLGEQRVAHKPWSNHIVTALAATQHIIKAAVDYSRTDARPDALLARLGPALERHVSGYFVHPDRTRRCGTCAYFSPSEMASGHGAWCGKTKLVLPPETALSNAHACELWESELDCQHCGACCREAFDTLEMSPADPFVQSHRKLVVLRDDVAQLQRPDGLCPLLSCKDRRYACTDYEARPEPCREFTAGSANCAFARRRVGWSR